ncbi:MAG: RES domain-containing protein [Bacteroidetes bacterium]|nr:RES domain-containing protein [Bacteroidota bacterium]
MDFPDIFNRPLTSINPGDNYIDVIDKHLDAFVVKANEWISELISSGKIPSDDLHIYLKRINQSKEDIIEILKEYTYRDRLAAIEKLKKYFRTYRGFILNKSLYGTLLAKSTFYRFRANEIKPIEKNEHAIFHIPFSKRRLVSNNRFNAHGIPCFYCADDLYIAWREVKSPGKFKFATTDQEAYFNVGLFRNSIDVDYIDLSLRDFNEVYSNETVGTFLSYIYLYPLILSLHTKIDYTGTWAAFHHEYVMPSFIMDIFLSGFKQIFANANKLQCIRYLSVEDDKRTNGYNYVFPAQYAEKSPQDYCSNLANIFLQKDSFKYVYQDELVATGKTKIDIMDFPDVMKMLNT